ncbi:MAG TPA: hypothetical protein EYP56_00720 [Planctomycetaceae bacterium]|nr:hypothetical protein [Planctomycetaceae bacterium]HIQ21897.1 hypothetical protein [Planctomycetota bacterium]
MGKKRPAADEIRRKLQAAEAHRAAGLTIEQVCRRLRISRQTFYRWRKQYGQAEPIEVSELARLRELEAENARLKERLSLLEAENAQLQSLVVAQALDIHKLKEQLKLMGGSSEANPSGLQRGGRGGEQLPYEQFDKWETAYTVCRRRNSPIVAKVDAVIAQIWPSGRCQLLYPAQSEPEETIYGIAPERTEQERRSHNPAERHQPVISAD